MVVNANAYRAFLLTKAAFELDEPRCLVPADETCASSSNHRTPTVPGTILSRANGPSSIISTPVSC